jgi:DEAD/DEAH box helicase domain-containing protein
LHVHHITPLREFSNAEAANNMDNLISLCPTCHMKMENNDGDT